MTFYSAKRIATRIGTGGVIEKNFFLNKTALEILSLCDGKHSFEDIVDVLHKKYDADIDQIKKDIYDIIQLFIKYDIIETIEGDKNT